MDHCAEHLMEILMRITYREIEASVEGGGGPGEAPGRTVVIVKSADAPSMDEIPIISSILDSLALSGVYDVRFMSYEAGRGSREEALASALSEALATVGSAVALIPSPLAAGLLGRLPRSLISRMEEAPRVEVSVSTRNILYLPEPSKSRSITIVGKRNSVASYERIRILESRARELGLEVRGHVLLNSNHEILEFVAEPGPMGMYSRVPITKLAYYILAASRCLGMEGLEEVFISDRSEHTVYFIGLPVSIAEEAASRMTGSVEGLELHRRHLRGVSLRGHIEWVARVIRALRLG